MVAFALDQNGQRVPIANGMICTWLVDMFGGPVPPENKWYKIPDERLHSGMVVAYVNFVEFLEQVGMITLFWLCVVSGTQHVVF